MRVTFYVRRVTPGQYSLERVLENLLSALGGRVEAAIWRARGGPQGLTDLVRAALVQGDVNHIAGHVHYLGSVLDPARTVLTVHDIGHLLNVRRSVRGIYRYLWYERPLSRVAAVTTVSEFTKAQLVREFGVKPESVRVIHNCVPEGFFPSPVDFDPSRPTILVVGTAPHKNAERLVEAVGDVACRLLFVGRVSDELGSMLARKGMQFEERHDLGEADLAECYRRSDIVYFASTYEGFGLPIVEAQAVGRPVITSRLCSMPEVAGDAALLIDPYDIAAIRDAVLRLFGSSDLRAEMVGKGFENAKRFDRTAFADAYLDTYRRVAS